MHRHYHHEVEPGLLTVVTGPAEEPLSLDEAKAHLRIDPGLTDDDAYIASIITAARQRIEIETSRSLVSQTLQLAADRLPVARGFIMLRRPPVQSITSVTYVASDGTTTTLPPNTYQLVRSEPAKLILAYGQAWPTGRVHEGSVNVTFVAGFGGATNVPELAKAAMRMIIGHLYENREEVTTSRVNQPFELPRGVQRIVDLFKWGAYQ